jgi:hypothetical protein
VSPSYSFLYFIIGWHRIILKFVFSSSADVVGVASDYGTPSEESVVGVVEVSGDGIAVASVPRI